VDVISAGSGLKPGAGGMINYYQGLLGALAERDEVARVLAFVSPANGSLGIPSHEKIEIQVCHGLRERRPARVLYEQLVLPVLVARAKADILLSTVNVKPLLSRRPTVVVLQSLQYFFWPSQAGRIQRAYIAAAVPRSVRGADAVIAVSEAERQDALRLFGSEPSRVFTVHHGLSTWAKTASDRLAETKPYRTPSGRPYLFALSRLYSFKNHRRLIEAFATNVQIALIAMVLALAFGLVLALMAISTVTPVRVVGKLWVDVFRNIPLILLILYLALSLPESVRDFWVGNAPGFLPEALRSQFVIAGIGGLVLYNSAVLAEVFRAGILSLDSGQREAAAALGLSYRQQMRLVVLPQGLRRMVPATVSQLITLNKDTTLVSIIAIQEVVRSGRVLTQTAGNPFTGGGVDAPILQVMIFIGVLFVIVNFALSRLSRRLEVREGRRTAVTAPPVAEPAAA